MSKIRIGSECPVLPFLFNIVLEVLYKMGKINTFLKIVNLEINLPLNTCNMIVDIKKLISKLLKLLSEFIKNFAKKYHEKFNYTSK